MKIKNAYIPINPYNRPGKASKPVRICVHYTGDVGAGADRLAQFYYNIAAGKFPDKPWNWTSTQYIVGLDGEVIRIVPDNEVSYAASGKNSGTIHIEVCYKQSSGEFEQASKDALRELVLSLMQKYNISADKVVRHYDLTGKLCPYFYIDSTRWAALHEYITTPKQETSTLYRVQVGAFSSKAKANAFLKSLKKAGFDGFIIKTSS